MVNLYIKIVYIFKYSRYRYYLSLIEDDFIVLMIDVSLYV